MPIDIVPLLLAAGLLTGAPPESGNEAYMRAAYQSARTHERLLLLCGSGQFDEVLDDGRKQLRLIGLRLENMFGADKLRAWQQESGPTKSCDSDYRGSDTAREFGSIIGELKHELEI